MSLAAWKFIIDEPIWGAGNLAMRVSLAVVMAESEEVARACLIAWAKAEGLNHRWLEVARVRRIELQPNVVLAWAEGV